MRAGRCGKLLRSLYTPQEATVATTRSELRSVNDPALYVALELGKKEWKLGLTSGFGNGAVGAERDQWRLRGDGSRARASAASVWDLSERARVQLLRSGSRWLLDPSGRDGARVAQPGRRLGEHRSEPAGATDEDGSD